MFQTCLWCFLYSRTRDRQHVKSDGWSLRMALIAICVEGMVYGVKATDPI